MARIIRDRSLKVGDELSGGLLFNYELREDYTYPCPKVYIPVRRLCTDDAHVVRAVSSLLKATGSTDAAARYSNIVLNTL